MGVGSAVLTAMLGTTAYRLIDSSMAVINIMNALKVNKETGPLAELSSIVKGIENAHESCEAFFDRTKNDYPLKDIYPKQDGEYRSVLFSLASIHKDVLTRLWLKVQILISSNKILRLLGNEEAIILTIKQLHAETIQEVYPVVEQDTGTRESLFEFFELGNLIGFWTDYADWGVVHPCYNSGRVIGFDPRQDRKILEALRFVKQKTIACADVSKTDESLTYKFDPITSNIIFSELNPLEFSEEDGDWVELNAARIWAHESAHFMDITLNPALMQYLTLAQYEELCALRGTALASGMKEYFLDIVQTRDWVYYLKDQEPAQPFSEEQLIELLHNLYNQVDKHFFELDNPIQLLQKWPRLQLPFAENQAELVAGLETEDCGDSRKAWFALTQIQRDPTKFEEYVAHVDALRGTDCYSGYDLFSPGGGVYRILEKLTMRTLVEGDSSLYAEFDSDELRNHGVSHLVFEREHFAEVIGIWVALQNDQFDIPDKNRILKRLEELPEIKYAIRLRECLNLDEAALLHTIRPK